MKKEYNLPEEEDSSQENIVNEPMAATYGMETEMEVLPTLTEEELAECITGDELREHMRQYIHQLFNPK